MYRLLFVVCCLLLGACYVMSAGCVFCALFAVCRSRCVSVMFGVFVSCRVSHVVCCLFVVVCCVLLFVVCGVLLVACCL